MIENKLRVRCPNCGQPAEMLVVANGFDDAPEEFTARVERHGGCEKKYVPMTAEQMHEKFGLPKTGWSETRY
jgi:hypothetical protein